MEWNMSDVFLIVIFILVAIFVGLYFLNKRGMKRMVQAQDFIDQNRMTVQIFVIDKRQEKPTEKNIPKAVYDQMPKTTRMRKTNLVRAKIGPQIVTLMCDNPVYEVLPVKKTVKVDIAGMYIVDKKKKTFTEKITASANRQMSEKAEENKAANAKANKKKNNAQKTLQEQNARFVEKTQKKKHR